MHEWGRTVRDDDGSALQIVTGHDPSDYLGHFTPGA